MKLGQRVAYVDTNGKQHGATVTAVPDTGNSGKKILNLEYQDAQLRTKAVELVVHGDDRVAGKGHWLLTSEVEKPVERRAPVEDQPIALARAEAELELPGADRRVGSEAAPQTRAKRSRKTT